MGAYDVANQAISAIPVIPSDDINIPVPGIISAGTATTGSAGPPPDMTAAAGTFLDDGVQKGDVIYNTTTNAHAIITEVKSNTEMTISANIFAAGNAFVIYKGNGNFQFSVNTGLLLFVGTAGNIRVTTIQGDDVTLLNIGNASWLPLAVYKVWATGTTAADIIAVTG